MVGLILSMLIMLFEVTQLFLHFLRAPKAGVPVVQTTGSPATWVSAGDILGGHYSDYVRRGRCARVQPLAAVSRFGLFHRISSPLLSGVKRLSSDSGQTKRNVIVSCDGER